MKSLQHIFFCAGLLASATGAGVVYSAGAKTSASVTIVAPVNVPESATDAYANVLFRSSTGNLSIRIPGAPARRSLVQYVCGWAMTGGEFNQCNAPVTLQVVNDGTLTGQQGVSLSVTRESNSSGVVMAMLAYN